MWVPRLLRLPLTIKRSRIQWDERDGCWRIAVKDEPWGHYEPLTWLRFKTPEAAGQHLGWRADF